MNSSFSASKPSLIALPRSRGSIIGARATLAAESFVDVFTVGLAVATFGLFLHGVHAAYLIIGGGAIGMAWFFPVL